MPRSNLPVLEHEQRRNALDAIIACVLGFRVYVNLDEAHLGSFAARSKLGAMARHGPHPAAQKSVTTGRPLRARCCRSRDPVSSIGFPRNKLEAQWFRLHYWGNWEGPHIHDVPLGEVLPLLYRANVGALSLEFANPRHQHEYAAFRAHPLPRDMVLVPGVIDSTTNYVEHPEVVANRLIEAVAAVGDRSRVIAGSDCGFGTFAGAEYVAEDVVWAKLAACRAGADLATASLWGR